jgi:uncharacterized membrane protein
LMLLVLVVLFGATGFQAVAATKTVEKGATKTSAPPAPAANDVTYPVNLFGDGKAHHFEYKTSDGTKIRYFVMKSSDGVIRAAFDACVVCWREGKGYVQDGDVMICKNCGKRFPSVKINVITGGCNPAPLTRKVENGKVIIKTESFQEGRQLFTFLGR